MKNNPSAVLSLTVLSAIVNNYIITLDSCAIGFWYQLGEDELIKLFHDNFDEKQNLAPLIVALTVDIFVSH